MKFLTAKKELDKIAEGRYHALRYQLTGYKTGKKGAECEVYIDGYSWFTSPTWKGALTLIKNALKNTKPDLTEAPEKETCSKKESQK